MNTEKVNDSKKYGIFRSLIKHPIVFILGGSFFTVLIFTVFGVFFDYILDGKFISLGQKLLLGILLLFPLIGCEYVNFYVNNGLGITYWFRRIRNFFYNVKW